MRNLLLAFVVACADEEPHCEANTCPDGFLIIEYGETEPYFVCVDTTTSPDRYVRCEASCPDGSHIDQIDGRSVVCSVPVEDGKVPW